MSLERLSPGGLLGWVEVLNDTMVELWHNITAVMERLDLVWGSWRVSRKSIVAQVDMPIQFWTDKVIWRHSSSTVEARAGRLVETSLRAISACKTLTLCNQVVLKVCAHRTCQALSVLVKHFPRYEREVVKLPFFLFEFLIFLLLIVELFLAVEEMELFLEHLVAEFLSLSFVLISSLDSRNVVVVLLKVHVARLFLLYQMLPHLPQMVLQ